MNAFETTFHHFQIKILQYVSHNMSNTAGMANKLIATPLCNFKNFFIYFLIINDLFLVDQNLIKVDHPCYNIIIQLNVVNWSKIKTIM